MAQQTAVELLENELKETLDVYLPEYSHKFACELFEYAKAIERKQIINSYVDGQSSVMNFGVYQQAEQYYIETYNK